MVNEVHYETNLYCLEMSQDGGEVVNWNLFVCENNHNFLRIFFFTRKLCYIMRVEIFFIKKYSTVSIVSILILSATVFVYAHFKELRTVPGKCFMFFAIGLLTVYIATPLIHVDFKQNFLKLVVAVVLALGFVFSFLWMTVMSFDVWWTFR